MSYADKVRGAANPQQAMLAVAEGIDAILAWLHENPQAAAPADPWGTLNWDAMAAPPSDSSHADAVATRREVDTEHQVQVIRAQLATETDAEERLALEARLRLLTDTGQSLEVGPNQGAREQYEGDEDNGVVNIPPPTPERQADRAEWANSVGLFSFSTLEPGEFLNAYAKGGPMWLYAGNRDGVMQMPFNLRQALVADVMQDSDAAAQEMARDILKVTEAENQAGLDIALDQA